MPAQSCFVENSGEVVMEAESYTNSVSGSGNASSSTWTLISDGGASGGSKLQASPNTGVYTGLNTNGPRLDYEITFNTLGTYEIWVRAQGGSNTDDSFHAGIDGTCLTNLSGYGMNVNGPWGWTRWANAGDPITFVVSSAGQHTLNLWMREDGVEIDKIVLTSIGTYPSGIGPASNLPVSCGGGSNTAETIYLEAECGTTGLNWQSQTDGSASNGEYSVYTGSNSLGSAPGGAADRLSFDLDVSSTGTYYVYLRTLAPTTGNNSVWVRTNGGTWHATAVSTGSSYAWNQINTGNNASNTISVNLNSGINTLDIAYRESGCQVDKIYVSDVANTPSAEGDAASNCSGGGNGNGNGNPPSGPTGQKVLFVVGNPSLNASDQAFKDWLETDLAYEVTVADDDGITESASAGMDMILISSTVSSGKVNTTFTNTPIPLGTWERGLLDDLEMATQYNLTSGSSIEFLDETDPMSGGNSGNVQFFTSPTDKLWATPNGNATLIAMKPGQSQSTYFRYDAGVEMLNGFIAPATRFILPLSNNAAVNLTPVAWAILRTGLQYVLPLPMTSTPVLNGPVCILLEPNSDQNFTGITLDDGSSVVIGTSNATYRTHYQYQHEIAATNGYFTIDTIKGAPKDTVVCRAYNIPGIINNGWTFVDCQTVDLSQYTITNTTQSVINDYDMIASRVQADGTVMWSRTFGTQGFDWFSSNLGTNLTQTSDGNLMMVMTHSSLYTQPLRAMLVKVNTTTGEVMWSKYAPMGMGDDRIKSLYKTSDNYLITTGPSYGAAWNTHLQKLNEDGSFVTGKYYAETGETSLKTRGHQVIEGGDGSYLLDSYHWDFGAGTYTSALINVNNDGTTVNWSKWLKHAVAAQVGQCNAFFQDVHVHPDGGYIAVGFTECDVTTKEMLVARILADGTLAWMQSYGTAGETVEGRKIAVLSTKEIVLTGNTATENFIAKLSETNGAIEWAHGYGPSTEGVPFSLEVLTGDQITIIGRTLNGGAIVSQFGPDGLPALAYSCDTTDLKPAILISDVQMVLEDLPISIYDFATPYLFEDIQMYETIKNKGITYKEVCPGFIPDCSNDPLVLGTPTSGRNYIMTHTLRTEIQDASQIGNLSFARDIRQGISYFDGLGRPMQTIAVQGSPDLRDMVTFNVYDDLGRETVQYLPFPDGNGGSAAFRNNVLTSQQAEYQSIYPGEAAFIEVDVEFSPLGRYLEQGTAGNDWQILRDANGVSTKDGHTAKTEYLALGSDRIPANLVVPYFPLDAGPTQQANDGFSYYNASDASLGVLRTENEDGSLAFSFTNKTGLTIMSCLQIDDNGTPGNEDDDTYATMLYIYDTHGNPKYVLQPEGFKELMLPTQTGQQPVLSVELLDRYAFQYVYDERLRLIEKRVPGAGWVHMVYNQLDQPIMTQDANQRAASPPEWSYTKYDALGRPIITGIYKPSNADLDSRIELQTELDSETVLFESRGITTLGNQTIGYTDVSFPSIQNGDILSISYFDDYDFNYDGSEDEQFGAESEIPTAEVNLRTRGMITGVDVGVIGLSGQFLKTVTFYDEYSRELQTQAENLLGGTDTSTSEINFAGEVLASVLRHHTSTTQSTIIKRFCYDHLGQMIRNTHQIDENEEQILAELDYNDLGQVIEKDMLSNTVNPLQSVDYAYNIRGWMTHINEVDPGASPIFTPDNDLFSMRVHYNTNLSGATDPVNFTGAITAVEWMNGNQTQASANSYDYDRMLRILSADYQVKAQGSNTWADPASDLNSTYSYDLNGNLLTLTRQGPTNGQGLMDDLTYDYGQNQGPTSNRLLGISDVFSGGLIEFVDGNVGVDYAYDLNGNMTTDLNKGNQMTYNHLNKVETVKITSGPDTGGTLTYLYDASGVKLRQIMDPPNGPIEIRDYVHGFQYITDANGTALDFIQHPEGRLVPDGAGGFSYEINLTDHQGNVRAIVARDQNGTATLLETKDYYAFGMEMATEGAIQTTPGNRFTYNSKELITEFGIRWADYGARWYDASIGRWNGVDAMAEAVSNFSPYVYVNNNPISLIDPDGNLGTDINTGLITVDDDLWSGGPRRTNASARDTEFDVDNPFFFQNLWEATGAEESRTFKVENGKAGLWAVDFAFELELKAEYGIQSYIFPFVIRIRKGKNNDFIAEWKGVSETHKFFPNFLQNDFPFQMRNWHEDSFTALEPELYSEETNGLIGQTFKSEFGINFKGIFSPDIPGSGSIDLASSGSLSSELTLRITGTDLSNFVVYGKLGEPANIDKKLPIGLWPEFGEEFHRPNYWQETETTWRARLYQSKTLKKPGVRLLERRKYGSLESKTEFKLNATALKFE